MGLKSTKKTMKEPDGVRGLVPSSGYGMWDTPYNSYLLELDPKGKSGRSKALQYALASASDRRFNEFLSKLYEPRYATHSLAAIAKSCDISLMEFAEFWQKAQTQRALAIAQDGLAAITGEVVDDARSKDAVCERCDGLRWVYASEDLPEDTPGFRQIGDKWVRTCPACEGSGRQVKPGDREAQKMVFEMTGMISKKGPSVRLVQNFSGMNLESAVDRMNRVTFDVEDDSSGVIIDAVEEA